jgi:hypothetical protein
MKTGRKERSGRDEPSRTARDRQAHEIERLRQEHDRLRERRAEHAKRIADLERQLALRQQNSTTTSKPPSSDGLAGTQRVRGRRGKSWRTAGGQPGHAGHHRPLVPAARVDAIVDLVPVVCRQCAHALRARHDVGDPARSTAISANLLTSRSCDAATCGGWSQQALHPTAAVLPGAAAGVR